MWICILGHLTVKNYTNIESIIKEIPSVYASRPTIFKVMDDAVTKKYLIKEIDVKDRSKQNMFST